MSPGKLDFGVTRRHLLALDTALTQLARHAGRSIEDLRGNLDERWTVERGLQLCVQNVLDIATHVAASAGRDVPDYAAAIDLMGQMGVIPADLSTRLRPLAGFRNALVHGYLGVDLDLVHAVLNGHLDEVREFARHVDEYVRTSTDPG